MGSVRSIPKQTSPCLYPITRCLNCDYSLEGLPKPGQCPECGEPHDSRSFELRGVRRPIFAAVLILAFLIFLCSMKFVLLCVFMGVDFSLGRLFLAMLFGVIIAYVWFWITEKPESQDVPRLVATPAGISIVSGTDVNSNYTWSSISDVRAERSRLGYPYVLIMVKSIAIPHRVFFGSRNDETKDIEAALKKLMTSNS